MFKNPIKPKEGEKEPRFPWNFKAPKYDDRNLINVGTHYGTGFNQPVGTLKPTMKQVIPIGCTSTDIDEKKGY